MELTPVNVDCIEEGDVVAESVTPDELIVATFAVILCVAAVSKMASRAMSNLRDHIFSK